MIERIKIFLNKKSFSLMWISIFIYTAFFTIFSFWKYKNFLYNAIDLAIFNQVFFNTSQGRFFDFSVHPGLYLGDHFTPFILFLIPIYALFKSPLIILFLQSLFLGLAAWPTYLIAGEVFNKNKLLPLLFAVLVLLNPILWNINLFDFHIIPFSIFFLLFAFYFYLKKNFWFYTLFLIIALSIREDVSLVVFMFGFLPFILMSFPQNPVSFPRRRESSAVDSHRSLSRPPAGGALWGGNDIINIFKANLKWILFPFITSAVWFILSFKVISFFNPDDSYKFLVYYGWLGDGGSALSILFGIIRHPIQVLAHLLSFGNLGVFFSFLLAFFFLPVFAPLYLILALLIFLQMFLASSGWGGLIFETHYASLFLAPLIISLIYGFKNFANFRQRKIKKWLESDGLKNNNKLIDFKEVFVIFIKEKKLLILIFIVTVIYSNLSLGPALEMLTALRDQEIKSKAIAANELTRNIPLQSSVVASYRFLANMSSREHLYSFHYGFWGKRQFSNKDYIFPDDVDYYLVDFSDIITYKLQSLDDLKKETEYDVGYLRLQNYLQDYGLVDIIDDLALFKKNYASDKVLIESRKIDADFNGLIFFDEKIALSRYTKKITEKKYGDFRIVDCSFDWIVKNRMENDYDFKISIADKAGNVVWEKIYPLGCGIYPSSKWEAGETVTTNHRFLLPEKFLTNDYDTSLNLIVIKKGYAGLDGIRSAANFIGQADRVGSLVILK